MVFLHCHPTARIFTQCRPTQATGSETAHLYLGLVLKELFSQQLKHPSEQTCFVGILNLSTSLPLKTFSPQRVKVRDSCLSHCMRNRVSSYCVISEIHFNELGFKRFAVPKKVLLTIQVFRNMTLCRETSSSRSFEGS
jgi:hypothetical protein